MGGSDIWSKLIMNMIFKEFVCSGCCSACVKGKRSMQYCRLDQEHNDDKSGLCALLQSKPDQSVTQCRQVLGHKGSNALMTEPLVFPNCSEEEKVQRCISSGFTPYCAELVSFSAIHVPGAHTATSSLCKEGNDEYGLGFLAPFTKERWEEWRRNSFSPKWNWLQQWNWQTD